MTVHELKTWPEYFNAVGRGDKTFEIRKDDRGFQEGDTVVLREFDPTVGLDESERYTGAWLRFRVGFVFRAGFGLDLEDYVVLSLVREVA